MAEISYYVQVPDNELVRLALLESAKESLLCSKEYHRLLEIRKEKNEAIEQLRKQADELISAIENLSSALPDNETMLQEYRRSRKDSSSSPKKTASKKSTSKENSASGSSHSSSSQDSEIDRLNQALSDVEKKLDNLS